MQQHTTTHTNSKRIYFRRTAQGGAALLLLSCAIAFPSQGDAAVNNIATSPGVFAPSFRDATNTDAGNTTFFGWGPSAGWGVNPNFKFDGATNNELIDNPAALQGIGGLTGTLNQVGTNDILSSTDNIYTGGFTNEHLTLEIPTSGTPGDGFTTIILQGRTAFGPFNGSNPFVFSDLGGAATEVTIGMNAAGAAQFWAKYEIEGNEASYTLDLALIGGSQSIGELSVDTQWSATGFSSDTAIYAPVPEPASASVIMALACCGVAGTRRMRQRKA